MIKINKKDNLYDIILKIDKEKTTNKKIILEIPFWHQFLYNYLSLKIIINRYKNKKIIISTTDIASKKIWKQLWIKYSLIKNKNYIEDKKDLLKYNYSFLWYFKYEIKNYFRRLIQLITWNKKAKNVKKYYIKHSNQKSSIIIFILLLSITLFIFFYIFYFTINKTYIYITPNTDIITKSKNFNFIDTPDKEHLWKYEEQLIKIEKDISFDLTYNSSEIFQNDNNKAHWNIEIHNTLKDKLKLKPHTRFISSSWIIFESNDWLEIEWSSYDNNWKIIDWILKTKLTAKLKDNKWNFIWTKWNIWTWVTLTIPGLNEPTNNIYFDDYIYWKSINRFTWWSDDYKYKVWKNDIKNAEKKLIKELKNKAKYEIKKEIKNLNKMNWVTYEVLKINNPYRYTDIKITKDKNIHIWDKIDNFNISWTLKSYTYVFNKESVINKMKNEIKNLELWDNKKILNIRNNISIAHVLDKNKDNSWVKATVSVLIEMQYNFIDKNDNYVQRLKTTISWVNIEKAKNILINEEKISNVKIESRPFFIKNVSPIYSSIEFIINE